MELVFIGNRYTQNTDTFKKNHLRTWMITKNMKNLGHNVKLILIDYKTKRYETSIEEGIEKISLPLDLNLFRFRKRLNGLIKKNSILYFFNGPVIGSSYFLINKKRFKASIYDIIDNYDTYYPKSLIFFKLTDLFLIKNSNLCTFINQSLYDKYWTKKTKILLPNGVELEFFKPLNKKECRKELNLSQTKFLVGYTGSIEERVLDNILKISDNLKDRKNIEIVLSGHLSKKINRSNINYLGKLDFSKVPKVINSLDLAIIPNRRDSFTIYSFPSKILEYFSCGKDVLVTPTVPIKDLKINWCYADFDMNNFSKSIEEFIEKRKSFKTKNKKISENFSWDKISKKIDCEIKRL